MFPEWIKSGDTWYFTHKQYTFKKRVVLGRNTYLIYEHEQVMYSTYIEAEFKQKAYKIVSGGAFRWGNG